MKILRSLWWRLFPAKARKMVRMEVDSITLNGVPIEGVRSCKVDFGARPKSQPTPKPRPKLWEPTCVAHGLRVTILSNKHVRIIGEPRAIVVYRGEEVRS